MSDGGVGIDDDEVMEPMGHKFNGSSLKRRAKNRGQYRHSQNVPYSHESP